jgi:hypothetical protein
LVTGTHQKAAAIFLDMGAKVVALKLGAQGSAAFTKTSALMLRHTESSEYSILLGRVMLSLREFFHFMIKIHDRCFNCCSRARFAAR